MPPRYNFRRRKDDPEQSFQFLKLSGEIRNAIYLLAVVCSGGVRPLSKTEHRELKSLGLPQAKEYHRQPAITRVSRQLRHETLPLYYAKNVFHFDPYALNTHAFPIESFQKIGLNNLKSMETVQVGWGVDLTFRIKHDRSDIEFVETGRGHSWRPVQKSILGKMGLAAQKEFSGFDLFQILQAFCLGRIRKREMLAAR
jgi:hypothetical protein